MRKTHPRAALAAVVLTGAAVVGIASVTQVGPGAALRAIDRPAPVRNAECQRTGIPGEWRCTFPTPGRTAAVYVSAWEDGSARAVAIDPEGSRYAPGSPEANLNNEESTR